MGQKTKKKISNTDDVIEWSNPEHRDFLNRQKHLFSDSSDYFVREANETERALCAQLMLVDTVLITGSLISLSSNDLLSGLSDHIRFLLLFAFIYLLVSIACGIRYYFKILAYNYNWAKAKHNAMKIFMDENITSWSAMRDKTNSAQVEIDEKLDGFWLRLQILFMCAAAVYYSVAFFGILFDVADIIS